MTTSSRSKSKVVWVCQGCGSKQARWSGSCPSCAEWNTLTQELDVVQRHPLLPGTLVNHPIRLDEVRGQEAARYTTAFPQCDRLLGGGVVVGSLTLLAGDPGIGKSTLMLHLTHHFASQGLMVLYICGEESVEQTALRARRLGITSDRIYFFHESNLEQIQTHIEKLKPHVLIVDSIQILYTSDLSSTPGSVTQVREVTTTLMHLAKKLGMATFLIGHVTKSGEIAGPRVLEHIVDVVLEFEGDHQHGYRMLRAVKNRFGPTEDIVLFRMVSEGLKEIDNPSQVFLEERVKGSTGSVIASTIEGTRPLLIEVQALVAASAFATSTRKSTGVDPNRLSLLLAVLEKRMGYTLHRNDVFVAIAGGLKITEPGIDLALLMAIASSFCNRCVDPETIVMGEVGLGGEVRSIARVEQRIHEASNMGFRRAIVPQQHVATPSRDPIELIGVERVEQAIDALFT